MIDIGYNRVLNFQGVAADAVNDLIATDASGEAIKLALCIHNCVGATITFTNPMWAGKWGHKFGEYFRDKGINLRPSVRRASIDQGAVDPRERINAPMNDETVPVSKPGEYEQIYAEEVQGYRSLFLPKR